MAKNYLITGYWGEPHVTAENDRGINAATFGAGRFVLPVGQQFRAEYIGNNTIRMYDGKLMDNGAAAGIPAGEYIDFLIPNAEQGVSRDDLIVFQYSRDPATLVERGDFIVIQGWDGSSLTQNDLLSGNANFDQMPLWIIGVSGTEISVYPTMPYFEVAKPLANCAPSGFGLGETAPMVTDLNDAEKCGWYSFESSALNRPTHIGYGCVLTLRSGDVFTAATQLAFCPDNGIKAKRTRDYASVWSEWEYENPPMTANVEYRTTERWLGKPVYTQLLPIGSWAKGGSIDYDNISPHVIRYSGIIGNWTLPFINNATDNAYSLWATFYNNGGKLRLGMCGGTNADGLGGHIQIWYYKL